MPESERRFVVLHHAARDGEHWDLMLETEGVLATWQLATHPRALREIGASVPVRRISDHRLAYLEYEGPISGDRGEVQRMDAGTYRLIRQAGQLWLLACDGTILHGQFAIDGLDPGDTGAITRTG